MSGLRLELTGPLSQLWVRYITPDFEEKEQRGNRYPYFDEEAFERIRHTEKTQRLVAKVLMLRSFFLWHKQSGQFCRISPKTFVLLASHWPVLGVGLKVSGPQINSLLDFVGTGGGDAGGHGERGWRKRQQGRPAIEPVPLAPPVEPADILRAASARKLSVHDRSALRPGEIVLESAVSRYLLPFFCCRVSLMCRKLFATFIGCSVPTESGKN